MKWYKLNITTLRTKSKEDLIILILDLYREIDYTLEALSYVKEDITMIENGDALHVHDNP